MGYTDVELTIYKLMLDNIVMENGDGLTKEHDILRFCGLSHQQLLYCNNNFKLFMSYLFYPPVDRFRFSIVTIQ